MFGIGLPELIVIFAIALIVVGPDKLPGLAKSVAKTLMELKKTAEDFKDSLNEEANPLLDIKPELENAAKEFKERILDTDETDDEVKNEQCQTTAETDTVTGGEETVPDILETSENNDSSLPPVEKTEKREDQNTKEEQSAPILEKPADESSAAEFTEKKQDSSSPDVIDNA